MSDVEQAYDDLANSYDDYHVDGKSLAENRLVARYLRDYLRPNETVVDLGCGTGLLLDLVPLATHQYVGVDISDGMLERARMKHPGYRFVQGDLEKDIPELGGEDFDVAVSLFGSASYCDLAATAKTIPSVVKPGGRFFAMFCGPGYLTRSTYINREKFLLTPHSAAELEAAFPGAKIWGMSSLVDQVPPTLPAALLDLILRIDVRTLGRHRKDACFFLNVEGRR